MLNTDQNRAIMTRGQYAAAAESRKTFAPRPTPPSPNSPGNRIKIIDQQQVTH
jgi:hypothetical protein